jgi:hypothetical protein
MKFDELDLLMMMDAPDIEYSRLPENTLTKLALCDELYIANYALAELSARDSNQAALVAAKILSTSRGDYYLQAAALRVLFKTDKEQTLVYITKQVQSCNLLVLNEIIQLMIENPSDFTSTSSFFVISVVSEQLKNLDDKQEFIDHKVRNDFLSLYGGMAVT